jgi:hypothetical protein
MNLINIFNFVYVYILYVIIYPLIYIPFALYKRLQNKPSTYSHEITKKLMNYFYCHTNYLTENKLIDSGFILSNHRCSFDFVYDPHISNSAIIGRYKAILSTLFLSLLAIIERRLISMQKTFNRNYIFESTLRTLEYTYPDCTNTFNKRIVFYPEGTRLNYDKLNNLDEVMALLKPGLLKSIYEYNKKPVQILITKNKEKVYNEFNLDVNFDITLPTYISNPIYPSEFKTFDEFFVYICNQWYDINNLV